MKFKIESKPSPLRQLDNIRQLKTSLKPIKADEGGKFLDVLLAHCYTLNNAIGKDFSIPKKELGEYLQSLESIPNLIIPIKLELTQKIGDAKSKFVYELII